MIPDLQDELNRKSIEAIQWVLSELQRERLSDHEAAIVLQGIWKSVSGLVDQTVMDLFDQVSEGVHQGEYKLSIYYRSEPSLTVVVGFNPWTDEVFAYDLNKGKKIKEGKGKALFTAIDNKLQQTCKKLVFAEKTSQIENIPQMIIAGVDIETTGVDWIKGDRITEIGIVLLNPDSGKRSFFCQRVNPERNISAKAQQITGLTNEMLENEPVWAMVGSKVDMILSKVDVLVGHNSFSFDFPFIFYEQETIGKTKPSHIKYVDTMDARWATPDGKPPSLEELSWCFGFGYDTTKAHTAIYDAELALDCYLAGREQGYYES